MAIARRDKNDIRPLRGATIRKRKLGATVIAGQFVTIQDDGFSDPSDTTNAVAMNVGVALQDGVAGETIPIVTAGPVKCVIGATPGATIHASDAAGEPSESAGSNAGIAGYAESDTVLYLK